MPAHIDPSTSHGGTEQSLTQPTQLLREKLPCWMLIHKKHFDEVECVLREVESCCSAISFEDVRRHLRDSLQLAAQAVVSSTQAVLVLHEQCSIVKKSHENNARIKNAKLVLRDFVLWRFVGLRGGIQDVQYPKDILPADIRYDEDLASQLKNTHRKMQVQLLQELICSEAFETFVKQLCNSVGEEEEQKQVRNQMQWAEKQFSLAEKKEISWMQAFCRTEYVRASAAVVVEENEQRGRGLDGMADSAEVDSDVADLLLTQMSSTRTPGIVAHAAAFFASHTCRNEGIRLRARDVFMQQLSLVHRSEETLQVVLSALTTLSGPDFLHEIMSNEQRTSMLCHSHEILLEFKSCLRRVLREASNLTPRWYHREKVLTHYVTLLSHVSDVSCVPETMQAFRTLLEKTNPANLGPEAEVLPEFCLMVQTVWCHPSSTEAIKEGCASELLRMWRVRQEIFGIDVAQDRTLLRQQSDETTRAAQNLLTVMHGTDSRPRQHVYRLTARTRPLQDIKRMMTRLQQNEARDMLRTVLEEAFLALHQPLHMFSKTTNGMDTTEEHASGSSEVLQRVRECGIRLRSMDTKGCLAFINKGQDDDDVYHNRRLRYFLVGILLGATCQVDCGKEAKNATMAANAVMSLQDVLRLDESIATASRPFEFLVSDQLRKVIASDRNQLGSDAPLIALTSTLGRFGQALTKTDRSKACRTCDEILDIGKAVVDGRYGFSPTIAQEILRALRKTCVEASGLERYTERIRDLCSEIQLCCVNSPEVRAWLDATHLDRALH
jgi:hypothetical protein